MHSDPLQVLDPAPRISIMHALTRPADFVPPEQPLQSSTLNHDSSPGNVIPAKESQPAPPVSPTAKKRAAGSAPSPSRKRRKRDDSPTPLPLPLEAVEEAVQSPAVVDPERPKAEFKELEMLFSLWMSAGRSVNLWDWLEAFRSGMLQPQKPDAAQSEARSQQAANGDGAIQLEEEDPLAGPPDALNNDDHDAAGDGEPDGEEQDNEEELARLHAIFIRFCEEARMLGLVRARGKGIGRRADEVVKGAGFI